MSTYEKIVTGLIVILIAAVIIFAYETGEDGRWGRVVSDFDESVGSDFKIGPFITVVSEQISGGAEENCETLRPVVITTLHDIYERLRLRSGFIEDDAWNTFEVNEAILEKLCNKNVRMVLADNKENQLLMDKVPFVRAISARGESIDIGTIVKIGAEIVPAGAPVPERPEIYEEVLIPDRFLK
jgi:hypothetical protein